jgi:peptidoglycan/LPS O-acetylase OafA/YrhL
MKALRPTAWLDGLRGFAALLVYVLHHELWAHESLQGERIFENAYGYEGRHYFVQLPFIRVLFGGGHYSVAIFFVISGYVLSLKPMTLLQDQRHLEMCENLASALFRRWLRLYILVAVTTFMFMLCLSIYPPLQTVVKPEAHFLDEVYRWYDDFKGFSFVFRQGGVPWSHYNFHAWTIPFEFKGSIIVYTTVLALFRCTRNARLSIEAFLVFYFMYIVDGWYVVVPQLRASS